MGGLIDIGYAGIAGSNHSANQDQNNQISLSEPLRLIQFFNSGGYHACRGEDPRLRTVSAWVRQSDSNSAALVRTAALSADHCAKGLCGHSGVHDAAENQVSRLCCMRSM